jgi:hypothetical protein
MVTPAEPSAGGNEKPEREEVVEPLIEPTPERRRERREEPAPVPEKVPEKTPVRGSMEPALLLRTAKHLPKRYKVGLSLLDG